MSGEEEVNEYAFVCVISAVVFSAAAGALWGKDFRRHEEVIVVAVLGSLVSLLSFVLISNTQVYVETYNNNEAWRQAGEKGGKLLGVAFLVGVGSWLAARLLSRHHHNGHHV